MNDFCPGFTTSAYAIALHATTADFEEFKREYGNIESDLGAGFYFTNTQEDAEANYAGLGPDLTAKVERLAERIASDTDREYNDPNVVAEARQRFMQNEGFTMPLYVRFENPVVLGGSNETYLDYSEEYDEETDAYGEPTGKLFDLIEALRDVASDDRYGDADAEKAIGDLMDRAMDGGVSASEAIDIMSESEGLQYATDYESDDGSLANKEIIRKAFEAAGFDGFIDQTVNKKFGSEKRVGKAMDGMNEGTVHYIAFKPTQVKSSLSNTGEFSDTDGRIRYSAPRFVSDLAKQIDQMPAKVSGTSASNVALWLKSNAAKLGIKAEELQWSGVLDYLQGLGKQKVSKEQVAEYLKQGGVKVDEVMLGNYPQDRVQRMMDRRKEINYQYDRGEISRDEHRKLLSRPP